MSEFELNEITPVYNQKYIPSVKVTSSKNALDYIKNAFISYGDIAFRERFIAVYLTRDNKILCHSTISLGTLSATVVNVKQIFTEAVNIAKCSAIILAHNHPSGNINPSNPDKNITNKIKQAAQLFDLSLLDHLIVTEDSYLSFADEGIL